MVECMECINLTGKSIQFNQITYKHLKHHNLTYKEYKEKYPEAKIYSEGRLIGFSLDISIKRHGIEEGTKKWEKYKQKQAYSNTLEYCIKKYGEEEGTKKYYSANVKRTLTLNNFIKKHGTEEGNIKWKSYCDKQAYTNKLEYFIEKYGDEEGNKKYKRVNYLKSHTYETYLERFNGDIEKATTELSKFQKSIKQNSAYSKVSQVMFNDLKNKLIENDVFDIYFHDYNLEWYINFKSLGVIFLDFFVKSQGKVIEFYGDYWHCNPNIYNENDIIFRDGKSIIVSDIWNKDKERIELVKTVPYIKDVKIVWENDFRKNSEKIINECIEYVCN